MSEQRGWRAARATTSSWPSGGARNPPRACPTSAPGTGRPARAAEMQLALVLQEVAARVNSTPPEERIRQPARWAYALRDAVALARPDWIVTHHDLQLEALAAAEQVDTVEDAPDADLAASALGAAALELTETLRGLYPSGIIAASLTGPATMAARLAARLAEPDIDLETAALDCGDALAALAAAHAERGASRVIVWEPDAGGLEPGALAQAHEPLLRRLTLLGLDAVASAGADAVLISDGPVPGDCDLTALRRLGERAVETKTPGGAR